MFRCVSLSVWLRLQTVAEVGIAIGAFAGCQRAAVSSHGREANAPAHVSDAGASRSPAIAEASTAATYPVDYSPPKDFFDDELIRILAREASATVACRLVSLTDVFPQWKDPDVFYDAECDVFEVIAGHPDEKPLHFIWQVERGNRMPPLQSELLVYLKQRKAPLDGPPPLKWVAVETGVMRYTPVLKERMHRGAWTPLPNAKAGKRN